MLREVEKIVINDVEIEDLRKLVKEDDGVEQKRKEFEAELKLVNKSLSVLLPIV